MVGAQTLFFLGPLYPAFGGSSFFFVLIKKEKEVLSFVLSQFL
jgi:hypothetical protein